MLNLSGPIPSHLPRMSVVGNVSISLTASPFPIFQRYSMAQDQNCFELSPFAFTYPHRVHCLMNFHHRDAQIKVKSFEKLVHDSEWINREERHILYSLNRFQTSKDSSKSSSSQASLQYSPSTLMYSSFFSSGCIFLKGP